METPTLDRPRIYVDFNEMVDQDLVLLSRDDQKQDSAGNMVTLTEGLRVYVYTPDSDETGAPANLIATGTARRCETSRQGSQRKSNQASPHAVRSPGFFHGFPQPGHSRSASSRAVQPQ